MLSWISFVLLYCLFSSLMIIMNIFDLAGKISEIVVHKHTGGSLKSDSRKRKSHCFFLFFFTPTNLATWHGQSQCEVAFLRYSHTPHRHLSWGQVPTAVSWTHGVIFFWMTSCGGTVTALHDVALVDISELYLFIFCPPFIYILYIYFILYIGSLWSAVVDELIGWYL